MELECTQKWNIGLWDIGSLFVLSFMATGLMFTRIQINGEITFEKLLSSLEQIFLRHPLLRATIQQSEF